MINWDILKDLNKNLYQIEIFLSFEIISLPLCNLFILK